MLLHKRANNKYHSGGLWTNACCSHQQPGEDNLAAAEKRLREEMGITTALVKAFAFIYTAPFDNGLTEYEFDHVFIGIYDGEIAADKEEVSDYCYTSTEKIKSTIEKQPEIYTAWFKIAFPKVMEYLATPSFN